MDSQRVLADRYRLLSHLARGGMADVYVAEDMRLGRNVAVKVLHVQYAESEAFIERFRREAQAAANLTHSGVVSVFDWGEDDGTYYMVMELIQGRNLRDVVRSEGALLPRRVAEIAFDVAAALSAAHAQGLVHRDVKPANILVTADGAVKVADFGIARAFDDTDHLTKTGSVIGTATYFSPEQAQGHSADARSDIYSLGVVMYELLTARPPFRGESPVAVAYQHVQEPPEPPSEIDPNIPLGLEAVVLKAMAKDPDDRYQSAAAFADDLNRVLAGKMPHAAPLSETPTRQMAVPGGGSGSGRTPPPPDDDATDERTYQDPARPDRTTIAIGILAAAALIGLGIILLVRLLGGDSGDSFSLPSVRGMELAEARATLDDAGLIRVDEQTVGDDEVAAGLAAGTDPAEGTPVVAGAEVVLLVSGGPANIEVPNVVSLSEQEARDALGAANLGVSVTYEPSSTVAVDTVMSQDPVSGERVSSGFVVEILVSAGPDALIVPQVVGKAEPDALFALDEVGFLPSQINIERRPSAEVAEGFVIEVEPAEGEALGPQGTVRLVISLGAVPSVVPDVLGQTPQVAQDTLEEFGFEVAFGIDVELAWDDELDGTIAEQDPPAGQTLDFGARVTLRVGIAATEVPAPSVIGSTEAAAQSEIEASGLVYARGDDTLLPQGDEDIGRVVSQSPNSGTVLDVGSTVSVSIGVEGVEVPNLFAGGSNPCPEAMRRSQAETAVTDVGLVADIGAPSNDYPPGDPCNGRIVSQSPPPGTVVEPGSTVTLIFDVPEVPNEEDVYGLTPAQAATTFTEYQWQASSQDGGQCHDPDVAFSGQIRQISPDPGSELDLGSTIEYWTATPAAGPPDCPEFTP